MKQSTMGFVMETVFDRVRESRQAGQKEYAYENTNAFRNFEQGATELGLDRKQILWIYARKHYDGIVSYLRGHKSQREDVRGRIGDLITYLILLQGMIEEEEGFLPQLEAKEAAACG